MHQSFPKSGTSPLRRAVRDFMVGADGMAGVAMLEFAIFAPMLVIFIVFLLDFGFYTFRQMEVQHAAQAGAEYVITLGGYPSNCPPATGTCPISTAVAEDSRSPRYAIVAVSWAATRASEATASGSGAPVVREASSSSA